MTGAMDPMPSDSAVVPGDVRELWARLFQLESDAILLVENTTARVLEVNPAACALYGYTRDEWLGMLNTEVSTEPARTREVALRHLTRIPLRWHRRKDGTLFPVEVVCTHFVWKGRDVHLAAIRDITQRIRREEELRATAQAYKTLADNAPDLVARFDRHLRHLYVSPAITAITGRPASDFIGKTNAELGFSPELDALWSRAISSVFQTREIATIEFDLATPGGKRSYQSRLAPELGADGEVACVVGIVRDITLRRQAETALIRSEQKYRRLYESVRDGFAATTLEGRVTECNQAFLDMLGYTAVEIVGLPYQAVTPARWHAVEAAIIEQQVLTRGHSELYEKEYARKDGTVFPVELRTYLIRDDAGRPAGMWAFIRDITERKKAEATLQQVNTELDRKVHERTARLRELTLELTRTEQRERRRIAYVLHEDLQQLLVAAKLGLSDLREGETAASRVKSADAALAALDQAIRISRSLTVELRPPVLYELGLHAAIDWLVQDMKQRMAFTAECVVQTAVEPASDDARIFAFEAARELLLNVAKHSGVRQARVRAGLDAAGQWCLAVEDEGRGFVPSNGASPTFGLFSIRERAEALGGTLRIDTEPGHGTRATLTLPLG